MKNVIITIMLVASIIFATTAWAGVAGQCSLCHSIHNSQNGNHMMINVPIDGTGGPDGGTYPSLTRGSCVGCHTGQNLPGGDTPFVYDTNEVNYGVNTLAGGNFKWVVTDDAKGHNVSGIPGLSADATLLVAPGGAGCGTSSCHETLYEPIATPGMGGHTLGTGCEGCHVDAKHHAPQQADGSPALEANGWFRFLVQHPEISTGTGVEGIEDDDWELSNSAGDHNEYLGDVANVDNTMTNYCCGCHGLFHTQLDANAAWIRHPSDAVIPNSGEYAGFTVYEPNVPIARPDLAIIPDSGVVRPGTDMVMCLSCHRAHGSPYDDLLRWEYSGMVAGGGAGTDGTGCYRCHTEKD